jgi:hypothetical protein
MSTRNVKARVKGSTSPRAVHEPADRPVDAYSIEEFCRRHDLSRATFFNLRKSGSAPRSMKAGKRRLITAEAAAEWRARMEAEADAELRCRMEAKAPADGKVS